MQLMEMLNNCAAGTFPPADGQLVLMPRPIGAEGAIIAFTNHILVAATISNKWLVANIESDNIFSITEPAFQLALENKLRCKADNLDLLLAAGHLTVNERSNVLHSIPPPAHERVERAQRLRQDVNVFANDSENGILIVGRGLDNRFEVAIELDDHSRGKGDGTNLALATRSLIPKNEFGFAQISPGNVASLRAFLSAGYKPIAAELLFFKPELTPCCNNRNDL